MGAQEVTETTEEVTDMGQAVPRRVTRTTTKVANPPVFEEPSQKAYETKKTIFRTYQLLWYILDIVEVLLAFRFLLKLVGADPASSFTKLIYSVSNPFTQPFVGIVATAVSGNSILEWSTVIAMAVYGVIVWGVIEFFQLIKPVSKEEVEQTVDSSWKGGG